MSMSRGCIVVQWTDKKWYTITAEREYDYEFDDFTITGPFPDRDRAWNGHSGCNPGSLTTVKCKTQKDLGYTHLIKALRKYIRNGYKNPSYVPETVIRHRRAW